MAAPIVAGTAESNTTSAGTSHVLVWTGLGTVAANDLILIVSAIGSTAATYNAHADYTELQDENIANSHKILYRWAVGGETAPTFTSSASTRDATVTLRITGAENPATQAPQIGTIASGSSTTPDPPSITPTGGPKDFLYIACWSSAGEQADDDTYVTTFPTNYSHSQNAKTCGVAGTNLGGLVGVATRQTTASSSDDPGTATVSENAAWRAQTIAVHPAPVVPKIPILVTAPRAWPRYP